MIWVREHSWGSKHYKHQSKCPPKFQFPCLPFVFIVIYVSILLKSKRWIDVSKSIFQMGLFVMCNVIVIDEIFVVKNHIICPDVHLSILWFLANSLMAVAWVRKRPENDFSLLLITEIYVSRSIPLFLVTARSSWS